MQVKIFERAVNLLKDGGRLVYSTCSLNPVENEAVVCALLNKFKGTLRLVDVSDKLNGLEREPGMKTWHLMDSKGNFFSSWDDVVSPVLQKAWSQDMFPPANIDEIPIERCMRLLPQRQNTGGFFVSVFEKISNDPLEKEQQTRTGTGSVVSSLTGGGGGGGGIYRPTNGGRGAFKEEPFVFLDAKKDGYLDEIKREFNFKDGFPFDQLLIRQENTSSPKLIYLVSEAVKDLLLSGNNHQLHAINTGVKAFSRCTDKLNDLLTVSCPYRVQHDSVSVFKPFIQNRTFDISSKDMKLCLATDADRHDFTAFESHKQWSDLSVGSLIFRHASPCGRFESSISVWKGKSTIQTMVNAAERNSLLNLLDFSNI